MFEHFLDRLSPDERHLLAVLRACSPDYQALIRTFAEAAFAQSEVDAPKNVLPFRRTQIA